jgi:hypothetical protein
MPGAQDIEQIKVSSGCQDAGWLKGSGEFQDLVSGPSF